MILCQCTGVTDKTIRTLIGAGTSTVAEITRQCGAGRCCAPCRDAIRAMICSARPQHPGAAPQAQSEARP